MFEFRFTVRVRVRVSVANVPLKGIGSNARKRNSLWFHVESGFLLIHFEVA